MAHPAGLEPAPPGLEGSSSLQGPTAAHDGIVAGDDERAMPPRGRTPIGRRGALQKDAKALSPLATNAAMCAHDAASSVLVPNLHSTWPAVILN